MVLQWYSGMLCRSTCCNCCYSHLNTDVLYDNGSISNCYCNEENQGITEILVASYIVLMYVSHYKPFQGDWVVSINEKITKGFSDQCKWWPPVELMRRIIFIIFLNIVPGNLVCSYVYASSLNHMITYFAVFVYIGSSIIIINECCDDICL